MATSASDRLAKLFGGNQLPTRSSPDKPTFAEQELAAMAERNAKWKIPETAQYPRKVQSEQPKPAAGGEIYTSSEDDDDYAAAFQKTSKMISTPAKTKSHKPSPRRLPESNAFGYDSAQVQRKGTIAYASNGSNTYGTSAHEDEVPLTQDLPKVDGQGNPATGHFCQFGLLRNFPYKYMIDDNDRVSKHFFANQKFLEREWDLYYLHQPESFYSSRPLLFLPYHQVKSLIDKISVVFKAEIHVPPDPFTLSFFDDGTPQPVFLGTSMNRADINDLQDSIPPPPKGHGEPPGGCSKGADQSFAAFKAKVERAQAAEKRKKAAVKKKKANDRFLNIQDWCKQLRRAQRYLGVRPEPFQIPAPPPDLTWEQQEIFIKEQEKKSGIRLDPFEVGKPAPHDFQKNTIIVSVDIESYERQHDIITEVGISTLDTLDLAGIAPREGGAGWTKQIRSRHFRIKGREHYVNRDFCIGDGNAFQFGESEWVDIEKIGDMIDSCFEWPFSVQYKHNGKLKFHTQTWDEAVTQSEEARKKAQEQNGDVPPSDGNHDDSEASTVTHVKRHADDAGTHSSTGGHAMIPSIDAAQKGPKERNIILVGHDLPGDLAYLSKLNSTVFSCPREISTQYPCASSPSMPDSSDPRVIRGARILSHILEALDTGILYKVLLKEQNPRSLTSVMADIGRSAFYPHNGGNDARYTLEALIGLVIKSRVMDDHWAVGGKDGVEK